MVNLYKLHVSINSHLQNSGHKELNKKKIHEQLQLFYQHEQNAGALMHQNLHSTRYMQINMFKNYYFKDN